LGRNFEAIAADKVVAWFKWLENQAHRQRDEDNALASRPDVNVKGACRGRARRLTDGDMRYDPALPPKRDDRSRLDDGEYDRPRLRGTIAAPAFRH
jgi:hypothetical protein